MKTKYIFLVLIFTLFISNLQAQQWESLGPDDFDQPTPIGSAYDEYIFAQDSKGALYVAYNVGSHTSEKRIILSKKIGSTWETVGGAGSIVGRYEYFASIGLSFDKSDNPYISYAEKDIQDKLIVKKWNGTVWEIIGGNSGVSSSSVLETSIVIDDLGNPYVLYKDEANSYYSTVKKWDGSTWKTIGTEAFFKGSLGSSIGLDSMGNPYVVSSEYKDTIIKRWNGSQWETIFEENVYYEWIGLDNTDKIYAAQIEYPGTKATVKTWNGTSWEILGSAGFTGEGVEDITMEFNSSGMPYVAYAIQYYENGYWKKKVISKKWNGVSWENIGNSGFLVRGRLDGAPGYENSPTRLCMTIDKSEIPYLSYTEFYRNSEVKIRKYDGSAWELIGETGISERYCYGNNSPSLALDTPGNPFIFYLEIEPDNVKKGKVIIKKFNGSIWETIGDTKSFSISNEGNLGLDIDSSGKPLVAFSDYDNNNKVTVKRWNGNTWETIGQAGFSDGEFNGGICLVIDSSGMPYVAYGEDKNGEIKVNVKKFDGNGWEAVGDTGVYFDYIWEEFDLAIDETSDTPFIACADRYSSGKVIVKKFNGSVWETIGDKHISGEDAMYIFLTIDSSGTPYVSYLQITSHFNLTYISTVHKFNGSEWETIGIENTTDGSNALVFDAVGDLYFLYPDDEHYGTATIKKFDGNNWETVGNERFTGGDAQYSDFAIDNEGNLTLVYDDGHYIFAKKYATGVASVSQYADTSNVLIYPNPTSDNFKISMDNNYKTIEVEIYDILGKKLMTVKDNVDDINITSLSNGIYIIKLKTNNGELSKKLIVNK